MNELQVRTVPFMGTDLIAAQDADGQVWAGVRWMCDGIELSKGQKDRQILNIQSDKVLSKGASNLRLPTRGGVQEVLCLKLDFVPLWLAKISITPKMEEETPELAERLEQYQLRAKDVLASAFLPKSNQNDTSRDMLNEAKLNNSRARVASVWLKMGQGTTPEYEQICKHYASRELTGGTAVLPLPEAREKTYSAAEVGKLLGGVSANMVGRLANQNGLKTDEYGIQVWDKSKSSSKQVPAWRYNEKAVSRLRELIKGGSV